MAIVQISRIQHRSGLSENLPQLAKAEIGWVVDERRLFIGNGQLSDGAPELGNTEILTEYSDILALSNSYTYKNEDAGYVPQTGNAKAKFTAIAYDGASNYVVVGEDGNILHSIDGLTWYNVDSGTVNDLLSVTYGLGKFVAVGTNGTVIYSTDGTAWQTSGPVVYTAINGIAYSSTDEQFVIVTLLGSVYTSTDGVTWVAQTSGVTTPLNDVVYANSKYIAVGASGVVIKSNDAVTWTNTTISSFDLLHVNYVSSNFVATGISSKTYYSSDAITWYSSFIDSYVSTTSDGTRIYGLTSWGDIYRNTLDEMSYYGNITSNVENFTAIHYANSVFMAVTGSGQIWTSSDAVTWSQQTSPVAYGINDIFYANSLWVLVGDRGSNNRGIIVTSTDAATFTQQTSPTLTLGNYDLLSVKCVDNTTWIAVGSGGAVITSSNAITWTERFSGVSADLRSICVADLGGGSFTAIAVGRGGVGVKSSGDNVTTGSAWTTTINNTATDPVGNTVTVGDMNKIIYQTFTPPSSTPRSRYIVVGDDGLIMTSTNGTNWYTKTSSTFANFNSVTYSNLYFIVVGSSGLTYAHSQDSDSWTPNSNIFGANLLTPDIHNIATNTTKNLMSAKYGVIYSATSQVKYFKSISQNLVSNLEDMIYSNKFLTVGSKGLVAYSTNSTTWTSESYSYGNSTTIRSLQRKLDDFVSVKDFGARGDGVTDDTEAINRALYELYCRVSNTTARKILYFPGGTYIVNGSIDVPSHSYIQGEGAFNTIIKQTISPYVYPYITWVMQTADDKQQTGNLIGLNGASMPTDININDISLLSLNDGLILKSASKVNLNNVRFQGPFASVTSSTDPINGNTTTGLSISGYNMLPPNDVNITNCIFDGFNYAVQLTSGQYLTNILFESCTFNNLFVGIYLNGNAAKNITVSNSIFDLIYNQGISTYNTTNCLSFANYYKDVGNHLAGYALPITNVIYHDATSVGCASIADQFDRTNEYNLVVHRVNETVTNNEWNFGAGIRLGSYQQNMGKSVSISGNTTAELITEFDEFDPSGSVGMEVLYTITRNSNVRTGKLTVNILSNTPYIDDDYSQSGDVAVTFSFNGNDLTYTSTGSAAGTLNYAIRYLEML